MEWNKDVAGARKLYSEALAAKVDADILEKVKAVGAKLAKPKNSAGSNS